MKAGKMRHMVDLLTPIDSETLKADNALTYNFLGTEYVGIEPLQGRELLVAKEMAADLSHKITIRVRYDIDHRTVLRWYTNFVAYNDPGNTWRDFQLGPQLDVELRGFTGSFYANELIGNQAATNVVNYPTTTASP